MDSSDHMKNAWQNDQLNCHIKKYGFAKAIPMGLFHNKVILPGSKQTLSRAMLISPRSILLVSLTSRFFWGILLLIYFNSFKNEKNIKPILILYNYSIRNKSSKYWRQDLHYKQNKCWEVKGAFKKLYGFLSEGPGQSRE